jgi:hypothetical protein
MKVFTEQYRTGMQEVQYNQQDDIVFKYVPSLISNGFTVWNGQFGLTFSEINYPGKNAFGYKFPLNTLN